MPVAETTITAEDLLKSNEIFLTNAVYGMRWVKQCGESGYTNLVGADLYKKFIGPLFK